MRKDSSFYGIFGAYISSRSVLHYIHLYAVVYFKHLACNVIHVRSRYVFCKQFGLPAGLGIIGVCRLNMTPKVD